MPALKIGVLILVVGISKSPEMTALTFGELIPVISFFVLLRDFALAAEARSAQRIGFVALDLLESRE